MATIVQVGFTNLVRVLRPVSESTNSAKPVGNASGSNHHHCLRVKTVENATKIMLEKSFNTRLLRSVLPELEENVMTSATRTGNNQPQDLNDVGKNSWCPITVKIEPIARPKPTPSMTSKSCDPDACIQMIAPATICTKIIEHTLTASIVGKPESNSK